MFLLYTSGWSKILYPLCKFNNKTILALIQTFWKGVQVVYAIYFDTNFLEKFWCVDSDTNFQATCTFFSVCNLCSTQISSVQSCATLHNPCSQRVSNLLENGSNSRRVNSVNTRVLFKKVFMNGEKTSDRWHHLFTYEPQSLAYRQARFVHSSIL